MPENVGCVSEIWLNKGKSGFIYTFKNKIAFKFLLLSHNLYSNYEVKIIQLSNNFQMVKG